MERVNQNHPEVAPATDSDENSQYYVLQNEPSNLIGPLQYFGSNHNFLPIRNGQMPVLPHPGVYFINSYPSNDHDPVHAANFLPYGSQYRYLQQPLFQRYPRKFQDRLLVAKNSYNRGPAANCFRGQHIQRPFDGNSQGFSSGDIYARNQSNVHTGRDNSGNEGHSFTDSCFFPSSNTNANFLALSHDTDYGCYSLPGYTSGWDLVNDRGAQSTYRGANLTQSNILPMAQGPMPKNFPLAEDFTLNSLSKGPNGDTGYMSEYTDRDYEGCDAATKPFGQDYSQQQHGYKDGVGTNPPESSVVSSTLRTSGKQKGQRGNTPRTKSIRSIRQHAPLFRVGNRKVSVPRLVYLKNINAQPIHHITWDGMSHVSDGFDEESEPTGQHGSLCEESEPTGQNCPLCNNNLPCAPTDDDYEYTDLPIDKPPRLPEVAVLSCDHVFHSQCLFSGFDEESEPIGQNCPLCGESEPTGQNCPFCDKDLSCAPSDGDYEYTDLPIYKPPRLPEVAVLSCGHVFHSQCLEFTMPEELSADPPCFICLSYGES